METLRHQLRLFFTALMFYTRVPCPDAIDHGSHYLNQSTRYFPLIGCFVGAVAAALLIAGAALVPLGLAVLLAMAGTVWLTGAFHEDGFGDLCDGFGGGWTAVQKLRIMKDSRLGTYGLVGLGFLLAMKYVALLAVARYDVMLAGAGLVTAHALSRWWAVSTMYVLPYARADGESKARPVAIAPQRREWVIGSIWPVLALVGLLWLALGAWPALPLSGLVWLYMIRLCRRNLEGYTGDCLGAIQQTTELGFYIGLASTFGMS